MITGIGTVGSACVEKFVREGFNVVSYDLDPIPLRVKSILEEAKGKAKSIQGDVTDSSRLLDVAKQNEVEGIIHTVAITHRSAAGRTYPSAQFGVNAWGAFNVLEVARIMDLDRVIYTSSGAVYGRIGPEETTSIRETHPVDMTSARSLYAVSKYVGELLVSAYNELYGLDTATCRLSWVRGVAEKNPVDIGYFLQEVLKGNKIVEPSGGGIIADYSYNRDVANGIYLLYVCKNLDTPSPSRIYNLSSGETRKLTDIVEIINRKGCGEVHLGPGITGRWVKFRDSIRSAPLDIGRMRKIGFEPRSWEEAIEDWAEWLKSRL